MVEINGANIKLRMTAKRNGGRLYFMLEINGVNITLRMTDRESRQCVFDVDHLVDHAAFYVAILYRMHA